MKRFSRSLSIAMTPILQNAIMVFDSFGKAIEGVYNDAPSKNVGFQWTDFMVPINQYGIVAHIYLLGNQVNWNPKRSGKLEGITGV